MCIRFSSDGGRGFLSTKDPHKKRTDKQRPAAAMQSEKLHEHSRRPVALKDIVESFFRGPGDKT